MGPDSLILPENVSSFLLLARSSRLSFLPSFLPALIDGRNDDKKRSGGGGGGENNGTDKGHNFHSQRRKGMLRRRPPRFCLVRTLSGRCRHDPALVMNSGC